MGNILWGDGEWSEYTEHAYLDIEAIAFLKKV